MKTGPGAIASGGRVALALAAGTVVVARAVAAALAAAGVVVAATAAVATSVGIAVGATPAAMLAAGDVGTTTKVVGDGATVAVGCAPPRARNVVASAALARTATSTSAPIAGHSHRARRLAGGAGRDALEMGGCDDDGVTTVGAEDAIGTCGRLTGGVGATNSGAAPASSRTVVASAGGKGVVAVAAIRSNACASSPAEVKRASGRFARARSSSGWNEAGTRPSLRSCTEGTGAFRWPNIAWVAGPL